MRIPFVSLTCSKFASKGVAILLSIFGATTVATGQVHSENATQIAIKALSGGHQQTSYGLAFPAPLVVWVHDSATERSLAGVRVSFTATGGVGLSAKTVTTDDKGVARVVGVATAPGAASVTAQVEGATRVQAKFDDLRIGKATLVIVPEDAASRTGQIPDVTEYTLQGFVNGDTEDTAEISGTPVLTTAATDHSPDANYAIKGNPGTLISTKYDFVPGFGTLVLVGDRKRSATAVDLAAALAKVQDSTQAVRRALLGQSATVVSGPLFAGSRASGSAANVQTAVQGGLVSSSPIHKAHLEVKPVAVMQNADPHSADYAASAAVKAVLHSETVAWASAIAAQQVKGIPGFTAAPTLKADPAELGEVKGVTSLQGAQAVATPENFALGSVQRALLAQPTSADSSVINPSPIALDASEAVRNAFRSATPVDTTTVSPKVIREAFPPSSK